ncbi:ATP-binding protein [Streptomyces sp. NPDC051183]|uniref:NACHT domain-containing protein n=1 Tax=Streptomyces sp. NPDC051183 TaxID=3155165 RepID=UPI003425AD84
MPGPLRYADAVRLLGGNGPVVDALDRAVGGALTTAVGPAPELLLSLVGADAQLAQLSRQLVSGTRERIQGLGRFERTERLAAAHAVIVVAAYGDAMAQAQLPFDVRELATTRTDSVRLATGDAPESRRLAAVAEHLLRSQLPLPSPHEPYEATLTALRGFYVAMSGHMEAYVSGLAVWDRLTSEAREQVRTVLCERVPHTALTCYEEMFRQLAVDFPDVGIWADRVDHQATRVAVRRLEETVTRLVAGDLPADRLTPLRRAGILPLDAPVLGAQDITEGMTIPTLREAYVSADFRVGGFGAADRLTSEWWWQEQEVRHGLDTFLEGFLTAPKAVEVPILLLGLPGSGKSLLTKVLAARLPAEDFLVARVPLRDVPADADVQDQIEVAIRQATGERTIDWAGVVRAAGPALPVVLLDGFDELLQATGAHQSDYLERVAAFQQREAALGRPLAVIVTSRTVVADRARLTPGGIALRLEPFSPAQTGQWLDTWNRTNADHFGRHGLLPLDPEQALAQPDLASQPLLLLLLALYDAQDNAYQQEAGTLAGYELYERLLVRFARREVLKHDTRLPEEGVAQAVEYELLRLAVAAFGMFNRARQWITEEELEEDLKALLPHQEAASTGLRARLTRAQTTIGRFFFVHQAQAFRDAGRLHSYEFLHATFGEFLVARLLAHELRDLLKVDRAEAGRARRPPTDDSFLYALLSFAACAWRQPVVEFLTEVLRRLPERDLDDLGKLLLRLFHESLEARPASSYDSYRPAHRPTTAAPAFYQAHLLLLLLILAGEVTGQELFPTTQNPVGAWRKTALLLESQLPAEDWQTFAGWVYLERTWTGEERGITLRWATDQDVETWAWPPVYSAENPRVVDPYWVYGQGPESEGRRYVGWLYTSPHMVARHAYLRCETGTDALLHMAQSLDEYGLSLALTSYVAARPGGEMVSAARLLIRLWSAAGDFSTTHRDAVKAALHSFDPDATDFIKRYLAAVLNQWELAGRPVPQDWVDRAHALIDARAENEAYEPLLAELPDPPAA